MPAWYWMRGGAIGLRRLLIVALRRVSPFFCCRLPRPARGFWSVPCHWAVIGRHVGGPSQDFGEVLEQFRPRLQLGFQASRQIRDTVGSGKAAAAASSTINRAVIPPERLQRRRGGVTVRRGTTICSTGDRASVPTAAPPAGTVISCRSPPRPLGPAHSECPRGESANRPVYNLGGGQGT